MELLRLMVVSGKYTLMYLTVEARLSGSVCRVRNICKPQGKEYKPAP